VKFRATEGGTIPALDRAREDEARERQTRLTKPALSLGRLEALAIQLAGFQATPTPNVRPCAALLFAADHAVTRHGVSPYPSAVTRAMLENFARGGAAASVLARLHRIPLHVFDVGVDGAEHPLAPGPAAGSGAILHRVSPAPVAGDIRVEDALAPSEFERCVAAGKRAVLATAADCRTLLLGEMGIGNSTVAAAIAAKLLDAPDPAALVGAGTGATGAVLDSKRRVVRDVVARLTGESRPLEVLRRAGGREFAAAYGAMRAALCQRAIVLVDGFILSTVAAVLVAEEPAARAGLVFSHRSREHGHAPLLEFMKAQPLLDLGMCLGEATGALSAFPLVEAACALHNQMATFEAAGVPERLEP